MATRAALRARALAYEQRAHIREGSEGVPGPDFATAWLAGYNAAQRDQHNALRKAAGQSPAFVDFAAVETRVAAISRQRCPHGYELRDLLDGTVTCTSLCVKRANDKLGT